MIDEAHAFGIGPSSLARSRSSILTGLGAIARRIHYHCAVSLAWRSFAKGAAVGAQCRLGPRAFCVNLGTRDHIEIGSGTVIRGLLRREAFGGVIRIGKNVYIGDDTLISCGESVTVGDGALIAHGVQIFDNDTHPAKTEDRERHWRMLREGGHENFPEIARAPVSIGAGAWLGFNSIVMKGVHIGEGAVIGAGSVVVADVPAFAVAVGNPARIVREGNALVRTLQAENDLPNKS